MTSANANILIVDDESDIRKLIQGILEDDGYACRGAANSTQAFEEITRKAPDLMVLDIWLQGSELDGLQILEKVKREYPFIPVIVISGHGTIETAVHAIKIGAYDFIEKPFKSDRLLLMISRALEAASLRKENAELKSQAAVQVELIGNSHATQNLRHLLERVGPTNSRILLTGEAGTGKDVVARLIHMHSKRANKPYMILNCATMHPERVEEELFGVEYKNSDEPVKQGLLEKASGGTLLLDEVSDMALETQAKIVRVLQSQSFHRLGGATEMNADLRILATSNKDLEKEISEGRFRQDLYYRLNVVPLHICPLRERSDDIPALVQYFKDQLSKNTGSNSAEFSQMALTAMQAYSWPGNIRQLRNVVEWVMIMRGTNGGSEYCIHDLPPEFSGGTEGAANAQSLLSESGGYHIHNFSSLPLRDARELFERDYLQAQINRFGGNISKTAKFVGMERSALHRKMKSLNISSSPDEVSEVDDSVGEVSPIKRKQAG